jgi:hypothetical protein
MNKFTLTGLLLALAGMVLVGFQALSKFMGREDDWAAINLTELIGQHNLGWAYGYDYLVKVLEAPLFLVLIGLGGVLVLLGMIFWRK